MLRAAKPAARWERRVASGYRPQATRQAARLVQAIRTPSVSCSCSCWGGLLPIAMAVAAGRVQSDDHTDVAAAAAAALAVAMGPADGTWAAAGAALLATLDDVVAVAAMSAITAAAVACVFFDVLAVAVAGMTAAAATSTTAAALSLAKPAGTTGSATGAAAAAIASWAWRMSLKMTSASAYCREHRERGACQESPHTSVTVFSMHQRSHMHQRLHRDTCTQAQGRKGTATEGCRSAETHECTSSRSRLPQTQVMASQTMP